MKKQVVVRMADVFLLGILLEVDKFVVVVRIETYVELLGSIGYIIG